MVALEMASGERRWVSIGAILIVNVRVDYLYT